MKIVLLSFFLLFIGSSLKAEIDLKKPILKVNKETVNLQDFLREFRREFLLHKKMDSENIDYKLVLNSVKNKYVERLLIQSFLNTQGLKMEKKLRLAFRKKLEKTMPTKFINQEALNNYILPKEVFMRMERDHLFWKYIKDHKQRTIMHSHVLDYYLKNLSSFYQDHVVTLEQIVVKTEEKAKQLLSKIKRKKPLGMYAKKYSISPEKNFGGIIGPIEIKLLPDQIRRVLKSLRPGQTSKVVMTNYGFHIVRLISRQRKQFLALEVVYPRIYAKLYSRNLEEARGDLLQQLQNGAKVEWMGAKLPKTFWVGGT